MLEIVSTTVKDIPTIQELSSIIWPVTFAEILSQEQIEYMMNMMYSTESLTKQIEEEQHNYVLVKYGNEYLGYLSYQLHIKNSYTTKIHKIYVLPNLQGKGVGKALIDFAVQEAKKYGDQFLTLNVNRYNKALGFYEHLGFSISRVENIEIGKGFLMEDYVMTMAL